MNFSKVLSASLFLGSLMQIHAALTETYTFNNFGGSSTLAIPDGNAAGVSDTRNVSSAISSIDSLEVRLNVSSEFNGDLYVYLRHGSTVAVLLNRSGKTSADSFGYDDAGFNVTLNDTAANGEIHTYRSVLPPAAGTPLTGTWQPDGRFVDPGAVVSTDSRSATLSDFYGSSASGDWTLFAADMNSGGAASISQWELSVSSVPEPQDYGFICAALLSLFGIGRAARARLMKKQ